MRLGVSRLEGWLANDPPGVEAANAAGAVESMGSSTLRSGEPITTSLSELLIFGALLTRLLLTLKESRKKELHYHHRSTTIYPFK